MASINGVEIKYKKGFKDHEGFQIYQGDIYIDGKKQGHWSQSYMNGDDDFEFDTTLLEKRAELFQAGTPKTYQYFEFMDNPDVFLSDLLKVIDYEKEYKKASKDGYSTMCLLLGPSRWSAFFTKDKSISDKAFKEKYKKDLDDFKKEVFSNRKPSVFIFRSLSDFKITVDKEHPIPEYFLKC